MSVIVRLFLYHGVVRAVFGFAVNSSCHVCLQMATLSSRRRLTVPSSYGHQACRRGGFADSELCNGTHTSRVAGSL